ncbi:lysostaphin resistance A-like protein [Singulisphaera sp. PoT]|uniref:CPBP family intramembrane glutamic endopeptidase n=1 Tax=Singulisphaera sp. PoT TaxID=3411797 RepID=UPI003BF5B798
MLKGAMHEWFGSVLTEELILRGYVFQCLLSLGGRRFGPMLALGLTSPMFGLDFYGGIRITAWNWTLLGAGFGVAYLVTRRLWLPIAMHFAWCLIHEPILGFRDSNEFVRSLVSIEKVGPEFWTGGWYGLERSPITLVVSLLNIAILLYLSHLGFWRPDPYLSDYLPRKTAEFTGDNLLS